MPCLLSTVPPSSRSYQSTRAGKEKKMTMKAFGLTSRGTVFLVLAAVPLCVGCVGGRGNTEHAHGYAAFQELSDDTTGPSEIEKCGAKKQGAGAAEEKLDLTAQLQRPLKFQCAASQALNPQGTGPLSGVPAKVLNFYAYTKESGCNTTVTKVLEQELKGATLVVESKNRNGLATAVEPVYTFQYTSEPREETHLCYTCNNTASESPEDEEGSLGAGISFASTGVSNCTVHITVPKKTSTGTTPSTNPPNSTSSAHTMTPFVAAVAGGFLSAMLRM